MHQLIILLAVAGALVGFPATRSLHTRPVRKRFWNSHSFEMEYQITALDNTVQVPAGIYENCIRVEATRIVKILADITQGRFGAAEGEITTIEWHALGVGLVKPQRKEKIENCLFVDGSYTIEILDTSAIGSL